MSFKNQIDDIISIHLEQNVTQNAEETVNDLTTLMNHNTIHNEPVLGEEDCYLVDVLLNVRVKSDGNKEYLVKWENDRFPPSWEPEENINSSVIRNFLLTQELQQHNVKLQQQQQVSGNQQPLSTAHIYLRVSDPSKTSSLFKQSNGNSHSNANESSSNIHSNGSSSNGNVNYQAQCHQTFNSYQSYFSAFPAGNFSLESQKEILLQYCLENKLMVSSIEMDDGVSARNPEKLKGLQKIVSNIKPTETLLVLDLSRFARNTLGGLQILENLSQRQVRIHSVLDGMNYDTPASRHCVRTTISCAQLESDIKSMKLKASIKNIKGKGGYIGSRAPFGFKIVREGTLRKLVKHSNEQNILDMIYDMKNIGLTNGKHFSIIAEKLNNKGFRNRGKMFTKENVKYILKNNVSKHIKETQEPIQQVTNQQTDKKKQVISRLEEQRKLRSSIYNKNRSIKMKEKADVKVTKPTKQKVIVEKYENLMKNTVMKA
jgi:DNA invertase Pin-like site-specific DNA recombinase